MKAEIVDKQIGPSGADLKQSELPITELISVLAIAGSGFFVDLYDIVIFSVVRISSLLSLGIPQAQMLSSGIFLLNMQLVGMIVGGFIWGILGDKRTQGFVIWFYFPILIGDTA